MIKGSWDNRFLELAEFLAQWSKDPSTKVGAVIVDGRHAIISVGYNGLPIGIKDTEERLNNRELKYKMVVHGELNALHFAERSVRGCTLYTWPFMPCSVCAGQIIQRGIKRVVAPYSDNPRWVDSFKLTREMFKEAGVELEEMSFDNSNPNNDLKEITTKIDEKYLIDEINRLTNTTKQIVAITVTNNPHRVVYKYSDGTIIENEITVEKPTEIPVITQLGNNQQEEKKSPPVDPLSGFDLRTPRDIM